jgi:hypothetical protein
MCTGYQTKRACQHLLDYLSVFESNYYLTTMDRFKLDALYDAMLFNWEICSSKARCLCPLSEVCKLTEGNWQSVERPQLGKVYK